VCENNGVLLGILNHLSINSVPASEDQSLQFLVSEDVSIKWSLHAQDHAQDEQVLDALRGDGQCSDEARFYSLICFRKCAL
jgi:hypothetical protein